MNKETKEQEILNKLAVLLGELADLHDGEKDVTIVSKAAAPEMQVYYQEVGE